METVSRRQGQELDRERPAILPKPKFPSDASSVCCTLTLVGFQWHVDADPNMLPPGRWTDVHGHYSNGTAGKPLFVSMLVYLDEHWRKEWDAETLFVDTNRGIGLIVQPRPGRCVLMHQDVLHRVSTPSRIAQRPRYSLVWKLVFVPKKASAASIKDLGETICRPEWGSPSLL